MDLPTAKDIAIILGTLVALITIFFGALEYRRQTRQNRIQAFIEMRRRFLETPRFREMLELLASDDERLREVGVQDKRNFLGFLEEIALMVSSGLLKREVAGYMFGHYVNLSRKSKNLWIGLEPNSLYWTVFHRFAEDMERFEREADVPRSLRM
ncbi:MAG TPA: hypothetical protein PKA27_06075 [Fimbriimonadaceae bacterium]|nr:hypothetical protein [Fimbriimonadaceae bacterium]